MGLVDGVLGSLVGGLLGGQLPQGAQARSPLLEMALRLLQQNGGIQGVLGKFEQAGLGQQAQSWIATGPNLPIDAAAISRIFGQGQLGEIAQQLGITHEQAAGQLAQALPQVVDKLTPQGQVPENHGDLVNQALAILRSSHDS